MSNHRAAQPIRLLVGIMLGAAVILIGLAVWMILQDKGAPVFVAVAGSMMAAFAAILATRISRSTGPRP